MGIYPFAAHPIDVAPYIGGEERRFDTAVRLRVQIPGVARSRQTDTTTFYVDYEDSQSPRILTIGFHTITRRDIDTIKVFRFQNENAYEERAEERALTDRIATAADPILAPTGTPATAADPIRTPLSNIATVADMIRALSDHSDQATDQCVRAPMGQPAADGLCAPAGSFALPVADGLCAQAGSFASPAAEGLCAPAGPFASPAADGLCAPAGSFA